MVMVVEIACPVCQLHFGPPDSLVVGDSVRCPRCDGVFPCAPAPPSSDRPNPLRAVREPWCYVCVDSIGDVILVLGFFLLLVTGLQLLSGNRDGWSMVIYLSNGVGAFAIGSLFKLAVAAARDLRKLTQAGDR